ncbi:patatin-like phospholipase family protein [Gemmata sp. JC717]|uniref:patatin-like phospholipase family protein n=1 Tax=Gemmata algarum TaxID=2975278 RepID=UPI0021BB9B06|nr:patatin-like phospholipase family protein [Gemmata algarum]MDY3556878.1 patatin-like phospholipase family protein [Gemmata algarum]
MVRTFTRPGPALALALALLAVALGCSSPSTVGDRLAPFRKHGVRAERTKEELKASVGWLDVAAQEAGRSTISTAELLAFADKSRAAARPAVPSPKRNILVVTGGGSYGAYPAGVLVGWTATGTRPEFDVVTGISTGALLGAFAFLGPGEDAELQRCYTTLRDRDIYKRNRIIPSLLSESLADSGPLAQVIAETANDARIARFAAEHAKGRRYYVGTTDLDARRAVVWDMGAIAARNTPESRELFRKVLLASAAIPGFFPPVRIPMTVDGRRYVERHIDGGTTSSMFFAPPYAPPGHEPPPGWLHGSNLYVLVAGKLYPDPSPVKPRTFAIASNAVSTVIYDQTRSDLHKLFLLTAMTGMTYNVSVIPPEINSPLESTKFDPKEMSRLFCAGAEWAQSGPNWRITPPGYEPGEGAKYRSGTALTDTGRNAGTGILGPPVSPIPSSPMIPMAPVVPEK